jgi:phage terminase large subunit-like protein
MDIKEKVNQYVKDILSGKIKACKYVKLACKRYKNDFKNKDLIFDEFEANETVEFIHRLKHSKGEWAGQFFMPEPWELFIIWNLFGWKRKSDGLRRFRTAYIEVARKNGKSTLVSALGNKIAFADDEPGAEVYSVATKRDQAKITHEEAKRMIRSSWLKDHVTILRDNLSSEKSNSKYEPLSSDAKTADGLNIHGAIVDELHEHPNRDLWDVIETGTGSRRQPLMIAITTAGYDRHSICFEQHVYTEKVLEGVIKDDTYFGVIYTIDDKDDWQDESKWIKANPNLEVSVKLDDLQRKAQRAVEMPSQLNAFLRKHLNVWTESVERWIPAEVWDRGNIPFNEEELKQRTCYAGLDLASTTDTASLVYVFPPIGYNADLAESDQNGKFKEYDLTEPFKVITKVFIPKDNMHGRVRRDKVPYDVWEREGFIHATAGDCIDYGFILKEIENDLARYYVKELAFDDWGSGKIIQDLQNLGFEDTGDKYHADRKLVKMRQGYRTMSGPSKDLEKLIRQGWISHNGHPVLKWMCSNVVISLDPAENIKPNKKESTERIDGIVALVMALSRAILHKEEEARFSFI